MRRTMILAAALGLLLAGENAFAGEWTSKVPPARRVGPKYGDFLKKEGAPAKQKSKGSKKGEKKDPGSAKEP